MHPRAPKLLEDIRNAADFVKTATLGVALEQFKQDRLLRQAVERNFEIIGEAVRRLEKDDPAIVGSAIEDDLAPLLGDVQVLLNSVG